MSADAQGREITFAELLARIGYTTDDPRGKAEHISICHQGGGEAFCSEVRVWSAAADTAARLMQNSQRNIWHSVHALSEVAKGRGTADDVVRLTSLVPDLDVKEGGCGDLAIAELIVADLSAALGEDPVGTVYSGHGSQPYWSVECQSGRALMADGNAEAKRLLDRFKALVQKIAASHGAAVDSVFDLARVMRTPGGVNWKDHENPVPVRCFAGGGKPVTVDQIHTALDVAGIPEEPQPRRVKKQKRGEKKPKGDKPPLYAVTAAMTPGKPSAKVRGRLAAALADVAIETDRHKKTRDHTLAMLRYGYNGEPGVGEALEALDRAFVFTVGPDRPGGEPEAMREFEDFVTGAEDLLTSEPPRKCFGPGQEQDTSPDDGGQRQRLEDAFVGEHVADTRLLGRFLFSGTFRWMRYDERVWRTAEEPVVAEAVRLALVDFCAQEMRGGVDDERRKRLFALLSASRMRGIMSVIRGRLAHQGAEFDAHPHLLNVRNGVVDLRDGSLRPHDRELMFTKVAMTDYDPEAVHDDWDKALTAVPKEVADWLQLRLGQGLTGYPPPDDVLVVLRGSGENGKSTIVDGVRGGVGIDYAVALADRALLVRPGDHPTELMTLRDARLVILEEFPELGHLSVKQLKTLLGTEYITARYCGRDNVTWRATHTPFVTTNYLPRVDESDHGTWRRLALVEFPYRYRKAHEAIERPSDVRGDGTLRQRVRDGHDGQHEAVLAWLVKGAMRWYRDGQAMPDPPAAVRAATAGWRGASDVLWRYVGERLVFDPEAHVMSKELYEDFTGWLKDNGHHGWTDQSFSARLAQHSLVADHGVTKQDRVRSSRKGLSRPPRRLGWGGSNGKVPNQYGAWLGVGFCAESGCGGSDGEADDLGE